MSYKKMNFKGFLFLAMLLASILLISADKSDKKDDNTKGIDESKYYGGGWGYGGPWRGGWGYGGPWRGGYGGWGGPWRGGWGGGYGGPWRGGYGGWGGGWPKEHTDAEPHN